LNFSKTDQGSEINALAGDDHFRDLYCGKIILT